MPQFDFFTFAQQSFLVLVTFYVLYFFILIRFLPALSETIKVRNKLIKLYGKQAAKVKVDLVSLYYKHLFKAK